MIDRLIARASAAVLIAVLSGCGGIPDGTDAGAPIPNAPRDGETTSSQPRIEDDEPPATATAPPAFEPGATGAPPLERPGALPPSKRATAQPADLGTEATFSDGVVLLARDFARGTVSSEGIGVLTGAPFVTFTLTLRNGSSRPLDVSAVVVTVRYGAEGVPAAPLYDDFPARDFSGTIRPGGEQSARYGFLIPTDVEFAEFFVDIDGTRLPAQLEGKLPRG